MFYLKTAEKLPIKRSRRDMVDDNSNDSRKKFTYYYYYYYFYINDSRHRVCKQFYMSTLTISQKKDFECSCK